MLSRFHLGGSKRGCLGEVFTADKYFVEAGAAGGVPNSEGAYPSFDANNNKQVKKKETPAFVVHEIDIKIVEAVGNVSKARLINSVEACYI